MTALTVVSHDDGFVSRLKATFPGFEIRVVSHLSPRIAREENHFFLLDADCLGEEDANRQLKRLSQKKHPVIMVAGASSSGSTLLSWAREGALTILFKTQTDQEIKREWRRLRIHYRAMQELKEVVINELRFADFIEMIGGLTTDNDIGRNMNHLLQTLKSTFTFDTVALYITIDKILKKKIEIGNTPSSLFPEALDTRLTSKMCAVRRPIQRAPADISKVLFPFPSNSWFIPLYTDNRFIGLIVAHQPGSASTNTADRMLIEAFAKQASLALENARLYRDVLQAQDQLVSQEKKALLGKMAISLNHEINNPLSIISMEAQLLQKRMTGKEVQVESRLANIENNIERIRQILEKISSLELEATDVIDYLNGHQMIDLGHGN